MTETLLLWSPAKIPRSHVRADLFIGEENLKVRYKFRQAPHHSLTHSLAHSLTSSVTVPMRRRNPGKQINAKGPTKLRKRVSASCHCSRWAVKRASDVLNVDSDNKIHMRRKVHGRSSRDHVKTPSQQQHVITKLKKLRCLQFTVCLPHATAFNVLSEHI